MENTIPNDPEPAAAPQDLPLPEPSLIGLATGLAAQAMISMGVFPNPTTGTTQILLNQSRHLIETIAMLESKTQGNRTDEETETLSNILHELRMMFVAARQEKNRRDS